MDDEEGRDPLFRQILGWRGGCSIIIGLMVLVFGLAGGMSQRGNISQSGDLTLRLMLGLVGLIGILIGVWMISKCYNK